MRLDALETFIYVAEKGSFTESARELNLTQPTITNRIASLEADLSTCLFDRVGRCAHLTEAGQLLLPVAYRINSLMMTVQNEITPVEREAKGSLVIGISEYVEQDRIFSVLKTYQEICPNVELKLHFSSTDEILHQIDLGILDAGLCSTIPNRFVEKDSGNLSGVEIWSESLRVVVEKEHDLAESHSVSFEELCNYPSILPTYPTALRNVIDSELMKYTSIAGSIDVSTISKIQSLVGCGIGWSLLPESEIGDPLVGLSIDNFELTHSVRLFHDKKSVMSRAKEEFIELTTPLLINSTEPGSEITFDDSEVAAVLETVA